MEITFVTSNKNKLREARSLLGFNVRSRSIALQEIQSVSVSEVAKHKVLQAYKAVRSPVFVEDTGLCLDGTGGFPGPLIKWVINGIGLEGICALAGKIPGRRAHAETCIAFYDGKKLISFTGMKDGSISMHAQGKGFGWDSIFIPEGKGVTFAQMPLDEKNSISHRGIAFRKFLRFLKGKDLV